VKMASPAKKPVKIKTLFDSLDTNGDGVLSFDEAKSALVGKVPPAHFREVFEKHDLDHNGTLDLKEFTQLCRTLDRVSLNKSLGGSGKSVVDLAWAGNKSSLSSRTALFGAAVVVIVAATVAYRRSVARP